LDNGHDCTLTPLQQRDILGVLGEEAFPHLVEQHLPSRTAQLHDHGTLSVNIADQVP
jgi:hypothetical protein